jgi:hypothetical protein
MSCVYHLGTDRVESTAESPAVCWPLTSNGRYLTDCFKVFAWQRSIDRLVPIPSIVCKYKFYYHIHKITPLIPVLSQINPVSSVPSYSSPHLLT